MTAAPVPAAEPVRAAEPVPAAVPVAVYELYYRALSGRAATIELIAGGPGAFPDTGTTLRLPARPRPDAGLRERDWHRVALAHRALHYEAGTFAFRRDRASSRLRRAFAGAARSRSGAAGRSDAGSRSGAAGRSDLEVFLGSFAGRRLALQVFEILEDLRIDTILPRRHPGLAVSLQKIVAAEAAARPALSEMAARTGALEMLLRRSLGEIPATVPAPIAAPVAVLLRIAEIVCRPGAAVEDTAQATVHAYAVLTRLPNLGRLAGAPERPLAPGRSAGPRRPGPLPWPRFWPEPPREAIEGSAVLDVPAAGVGFRDELAGRIWRAPAAPVPDQQAVYTWRTGTAGGAPGTDGTPAAAPGAAAGPPEPLPHEHHEVARDLSAHEHGSLSPSGPHTFVYPEWDDHQGAFLPRWCRVTERPMAPGDAGAAHRLQQRHVYLLGRLRRLMQQALPEGLETQRRATDGDDIDFDAAVEALTDLRTGRPPSEACYQRLRRRRRDVAVGFLVDASSSTGERVAGAVLDAGTGGQAAAVSGWRSWPRVLDIEIVATALCLTAADAVGDTTAAWAFSGTGRGAVLMPVLKSPGEPFSGRVTRRMAAVKPVHATRMGAAIRHAAARLAGVPDATRLLLVLSDGCPYDVDYGQQYGDDYAAAYAAADTAHAVAEARSNGVRPFLLTVDREGGGYLARACPGDCEVLGEISALPEKLTGLYRSLTADS